jgi:hypothetical protein
MTLTEAKKVLESLKFQYKEHWEEYKMQLYPEALSYFIDLAGRIDEEKMLKILLSKYHDSSREQIQAIIKYLGGEK